MAITQFVTADNVSTTLATAASSTSTTFTLASAANLPTLTSGQAMPLTMNDAATGLIYEVVYVTAISGVTLTVVRAQEGTGAQNWNIGDYAFCAPTSATVATALGNPSNAFQVAPATLPAHAPQMSQVAGVVGSTRNLVMSVTVASATATLSADEIVVETALGGVRYCLANFSSTINLATTGAGGMDTGSPPTTNPVAIYAIYNPTSKTAALLATNASSAVAPSIYGGANMPSGYTASALVSVWELNGSGQFIAGYQVDRDIWINTINQVLTSSSSATNVSLSLGLPKNAKTAKLTVTFSCTAATNANVAVGSSSSGQTPTYSFAVSGQTGAMQIEVPLITLQTIWYTISNSAGTPTTIIALAGYRI